LSTTLLEVDMASRSYGYTGKTLLIPNNQFVASSVQNLNFMRRYVSHSISIIRDAEPTNVFHFREAILKNVKEYCAPFEEVALRYNGLIEKRLGISLAGPEASVRVTTTNLGKNEFTITLFCPTNEAVGIEQRLIEDFMGLWYGELDRREQDKENKKSVTKQNPKE
jgi:small-conductance mechanosensitive channel